MPAATPSATLAAWARTRLLEHCRAAAGAALAAGVTIVRDLGDRRFVTLRLREELAAHPARGPQLLVSGPPVTTPGGHCWFFGGEAAGVEGVRSAVRTLAARGVDVVKVMVTGGNLTPASVAWQSQYGPAELRAAVEEAHRAAQAARCAAVGSASPDLGRLHRRRGAARGHLGGRHRLPGRGPQGADRARLRRGPAGGRRRPADRCERAPRGRGGVPRRDTGFAESSDRASA